MRRLIFLVSILFVLGIFPSAAELYIHHDDFYNADTIKSMIRRQIDNRAYNEIYLAVNFSKLPTGSEYSYELVVNDSLYFDGNIVDKPLELKIDDNVFTLPIKTKEKIFRPEFYMRDFVLTMTVDIPKELIEKIKTSNKIAVRAYTTAGARTLFLTDKEVDEWKQVINK